MFLLADQRFMPGVSLKRFRTRRASTKQRARFAVETDNEDNEDNETPSREPTTPTDPRHRLAVKRMRGARPPCPESTDCRELYATWEALAPNDDSRSWIGFPPETTVPAAPLRPPPPIPPPKDFPSESILKGFDEMCAHAYQAGLDGNEKFFDALQRHRLTSAQQNEVTQRYIHGRTRAENEDALSAAIDVALEATTAASEAAARRAAVDEELARMRAQAERRNGPRQKGRRKTQYKVALCDVAVKATALADKAAARRNAAIEEVARLRALCEPQVDRASEQGLCEGRSSEPAEREVNRATNDSLDDREQTMAFTDNEHHLDSSGTTTEDTERPRRTYFSASTRNGRQSRMAFTASTASIDSDLAAAIEVLKAERARKATATTLDTLDGVRVGKNGERRKSRKRIPSAFGRGVDDGVEVNDHPLGGKEAHGREFPMTIVNAEEMTPTMGSSAARTPPCTSTTLHPSIRTRDFADSRTALTQDGLKSSDGTPISPLQDLSSKNSHAAALPMDCDDAAMTARILVRQIHCAISCCQKPLHECGALLYRDAGAAARAEYQPRETCLKLYERLTKLRNFLQRQDALALANIQCLDLLKRTLKIVWSIVQVSTYGLFSSPLRESSLHRVMTRLGARMNNVKQLHASLQTSLDKELQ